MTLHQLFEQQQLIHANRVALCFEDKKYTYAQLNTWANKLAWFLKERYSVSPGDRVLMLLPKCADQVAVLLALSKLGAIYVPLSPQDCPDERLIAIFNSTEAKCIISSEIRETINFLPVLELSILNSSAQNFPDRNPNITVSDDDIAYMIYTSGTTNIPKGVPIKHIGLNYWFNTMLILFPTTTAYERRVLSFCLASFDASIWEYLMAWVGGSALYIPDNATRDNPEKLKDFIESNAITHATLIPSVLRHITATGGVPGSLQVVCSTGEACTREIVEAFKQQGKQLFNCYGSTEETFGLSVQECTLSLFDEKNGAPIAYPVGAEIKVHIFDDEMREAEFGELYVESPYLTEGYWKQEMETKKNFIVKDGVRFYKTGDYFCRDIAHNVLRYKGRINSEVLKIRGALVNILEIEAYLLEMPAVEDACVIVCKRGNYDYLVANIQLSYSAQLSSDEVRQHLLQRLSLTCIPAQFFIDTAPLPLNSNAKKDRKNLQESYYLHRDSLKVASDFLPIENMLIQMLKDVLKIEKDDIRSSDTFFTLGGDSISRLAFIEKIETAFSVEISIHDFYRNDLTISALVDLIHEYRWRKSPDSPISPIIHQGEKAQPIFMLHPITGESTTTYYKFAKTWTEQEGMLNLRIYGINARGLHDSLDTSMNINLIAMDYVRAIKKKQNHGPYFILGWSFGGALAWKMAEIFEDSGEKLNLVLIDTLCPKVTQQCSYALYQRTLLQLVEDLRQSLNIVGDVSSLLGSSGDLAPEMQIKITFQALSHYNKTQLKQLQLISALLLANQKYLPKNISTLPHLLVCEQTQNKAKALMPSMSLSFATTLGWSSIKQSLALTTLPSAPTHFDFMKNTEVISNTLKLLQELIPLRKEVMAEVSNQNDHEKLIYLQGQVALLTDLFVNQIQGRRLDIPNIYDNDTGRQLLYSDAATNQQSSIFGQMANLSK